MHLPLVLPPVVVGFALLVLFGKRGPIGSVLDDWFGIVFAFRWTGAALASAIMGFPLMVRAIRLSIDAIDQRLEDGGAHARRHRAPGSSRRSRCRSRCPASSPACCCRSRAASANSARRSRSSPTFPARPQTLPLAIYTFTQVPGGDAQALRLSIIAVVLSVVALVASEWLTRRARASAGR